MSRVREAVTPKPTRRSLLAAGSLEGSVPRGCGPEGITSHIWPVFSPLTRTDDRILSRAFQLCNAKVPM